MSQPVYSARTTLVPPTADYAEALVVARRMKATLCWLLLLVLGTALTLFFMLRYYGPMRALVASPSPDNVNARAVLQYAVGVLDVAALLLPLVLVAVLLVLVLVQVAARTAGTGRTTSALGWAIGVAALLFPWQAVLNNPAINADARSAAIGMKLPGVVYTWAEVSQPDQGATFAEVGTGRPDASTAAACLHWARYALFPLLAMVAVAVCHTKSERGMRQAFGTDVNPPDDEITTAAPTTVIAG